MNQNGRSVAPRLATIGLGTAALTNIAAAQFEFALVQRIPTIAAANSAVLADFNGDARIDLAFALDFEGVQLYLNAGSSFERVGLSPFGGGRPRSIVAADFDGDFDQDIAWIEFDASTLEVVLNRGDGRGGHRTSTPLPNGAVQLDVADVDSDGDFDVLVSTDEAAFHVFLNDGSGGFTPGDTQEFPLPSLVEIVTGDFDGDGDVDVAALNTDAYLDPYYGMKVFEAILVLHYNDGHGQFAERAEHVLPYGDNDRLIPNQLVAGDFDNDGDHDFATFASLAAYGDRYSSLRLVMRDDMTYVNGAQLEFGHDWASNILEAGAVDFDLDGDLDLVLSIPSDLRAFENFGDAHFARERIVARRVTAAKALPIGDLDQDGVIDFVAGSADSVRAYVNISFVAAPSLEVTPLRRGTMASWSVMALDPGEPAYFFASTQGVAPTVGINYFGGLTLDLAAPVSWLGVAAADANGEATLSQRVPRNAPPVVVTSQAVVRRGPGGQDSIKTGVQSRAIQD